MRPTSFVPSVRLDEDDPVTRFSERINIIGPYDKEHRHTHTNKKKLSLRTRGRDHSVVMSAPPPADGYSYPAEPDSERVSDILEEEARKRSARRDSDSI